MIKMKLPKRLHPTRAASITINKTSDICLVLKELYIPKQYKRTPQIIRSIGIRIR